MNHQSDSLLADSLDKIPAVSKIQDSLGSVVVAAVLFHPFAIACLLIAMLLSFASKPLVQNIAFGTSCLGLLLATLALLLDLFLYLPAMKVIQATTPLNAYMGAAFWLVVISLALAATGTFIQSKLRKLALGEKY